LIGHPKRFAVVEISNLIWPATLEIPSKRFRLLVVGDTSQLSVRAISDLAAAALERGMVYCCCWGEGCERFHDIVDEVIVADDLGPRKFSGSKPDDVIVTTWHEDEPLEEALYYFAQLAIPTGGFHSGSEFHLVLCLNNPEWAEQSKKYLQSLDASFA